MKDKNKTKEFLMQELAEMRQRIHRLEALAKEHENMDESLKETERKFKAVFNNTFGFVGLLTADGVLLEANQTALNFGGLKESDVIGKLFWETAWWEHSRELREWLPDAIRRASAGEIVRDEVNNIGPDGSLHYIDFSIKPVKDDKGNVIFLVPEGRDITDRKKAEQKLGMRAEELKESNIALKVLLKQRENDKGELEENILSNIKTIIMPYIEKLKKNKSMSEELAYLNILETNLKEIVSPFSSTLSSKHLDFTPKEIMVTNLIIDGKQDKDITELLNISIDTVKFHRKNIRKKLGIYGKRKNLRTHLLLVTK